MLIAYFASGNKTIGDFEGFFPAADAGVQIGGWCNGKKEQNGLG
jgi:hypothetical protein